MRFHVLVLALLVAVASGCTVHNWQAAAGTLRPYQLEGALLDRSHDPPRPQAVISYRIIEASGPRWYIAVPLQPDLSPAPPYTAALNGHHTPRQTRNQLAEVADLWNACARLDEQFHDSLPAWARD
jgi:hypothetical protein